MLQNLLHIFLVSFISVIWGFPLLILQQKKTAGPYTLNAETIIYSFFTGIILIGLVSSWLVLFMPLNYIVLVIITAFIALTELWWFKKANQKKLLLVRINAVRFNTATAFFFCAILLFLFLGSGGPVMEDTGLYHIQIIRWDQQYGTVTGLANLYLRYGFSSNWFHLISLFSFPFSHQNFLFLNITLSIWLTFFLLNKIQLSFSNPQSRPQLILGIFSFLVLAYMLMEWDLLRGNASSTSYDFIVTALILIVLSLITENFLMEKEPGNNFILILLLSIGIPFFKLTGIFILPIAFVYFIITRQALKRYFSSLIIFLLFLVPYLAKNYIQTGYFIYPFQAFSGILKPDWQVPGELLTRFTDYMNLGNRYINHSIPRQAWESNHGMFFGWIPVWMRSLTLFDKILSVLTVAGIFLSFLIPSFRQKRNHKLKSIYYSCILLLPCWFFTSPDPRFVYGLLLFIAFLPFSWLFENYVKGVFIKIGFILLISAMILYVIPKIKKWDPENFIYPPFIPVPPHQTINDFDYPFYLPEIINKNWNVRCYDSPLPCIYQLNPYLETRGKEIKDGFRMKPVTDSIFILHYNY